MKFDHIDLMVITVLCMKDQNISRKISKKSFTQNANLPFYKSPIPTHRLHGNEVYS